MNKKIISIIIPIYNVEKYLTECIDSVVNQSYKKIEIILVNDGSPDCCPQICDEYAKKDSRIKVIHKQNGGLSDARNVGLLMASGQYVIFLDSDDFYSNMNFLQLVSDEIFNSYPDIIFFKPTHCNHLGKQIRPFNFFAKKHYLCNNSQALLCSLLKNDELEASAWSKVVKTKVLKNNNLYFKKGLFSEDIEWFLRLLPFIKTIKLCNIQNYFYRHRSGSITHSISEINIDHLLTTLELCASIYKNQTETENKKIIASYMAYQFFIVLGLSYRLDFVKRKKFIERLRLIAWVRLYVLSHKTRLANAVLELFGYNITCILLGMYIKLK